LGWLSHAGAEGWLNGLFSLPLRMALSALALHPGCHERYAPTSKSGKRSNQWRPKLWFRGGISGEGSYVANGDFGGTLDVSTFLSSFLAFFTAFFSFFACFRSPFVILDI
jgi:hypothetical protein